MPEVSAVLNLTPHADIMLGEASLAATHNRLPGGRNLVPNDSIVGETAAFSTPQTHDS